MNEEILIETNQIWPEVMEVLVMKTFGKRLKNIRETLGLTQEDVAGLSGLRASAISHFETGLRQPSLRNIVRLCRALHCKPNALIDV